jgi:DNA-binding response OmpR family regulator
MNQTILVVDDKLNVQKLLADFLTSQGFSVLSASNGRDAQLVLKKQQLDLILLDIMMPQMDGYTFISKLRESSDLPVIMITAKQQESDVIKGFELGADDYITKPFRMSELLMRAKAVLKRTARAYANQSQLRVAGLMLDTESNEVRADKQRIELTQAEVALLALLMQSAERAVAKGELCSHLIEQGFSGSESTLKIHMRNLRNKLEPLCNQMISIDAVFGVGYRLSKVA